MRRRTAIKRDSQTRPAGLEQFVWQIGCRPELGKRPGGFLKDHI